MQSNSLFLQTSGGNAELVIHSMTSDLAGNYSAVAFNIAGETHTSCHVGLDSTISARPARRPKFTAVPESLSAVVGSRLVLEARAEGEPAPEFKWDKDGLELLPDTQLPHAVIESDGEGHTRLVVRSAERSDEGLYRCTAFNKVGRCKRAASVWINGEDWSRSRSGVDEF